MQSTACSSATTTSRNSHRDYAVTKKTRRKRPRRPITDVVDRRINPISLEIEYKVVMTEWISQKYISTDAKIEYHQRQNALRRPHKQPESGPPDTQWSPASSTTITADQPYGAVRADSTASPSKISDTGTETPRNTISQHFEEFTSTRYTPRSSFVSGPSMRNRSSYFHGPQDLMQMPHAHKTWDEEALIPYHGLPLHNGA